mmetsp:Transcript_122888/g.342454  ORF Transcript_122888/g.342454 Transcript_122888/m.342454 type:complete len:239 (-) Transcript_122888:74-790(-)
MVWPSARMHSMVTAVGPCQISCETSMSGKRIARLKAISWRGFWWSTGPSTSAACASSAHPCPSRRWWPGPVSTRPQACRSWQPRAACGRLWRGTSARQGWAIFSRRSASSAPQTSGPGGVNRIPTSSCGPRSWPAPSQRVAWPTRTQRRGSRLRGARAVKWSTCETFRTTHAPRPCVGPWSSSESGAHGCRMTMQRRMQGLDGGSMHGATPGQRRCHREGLDVAWCCMLHLGTGLAWC